MIFKKKNTCLLFLSLAIFSVGLIHAAAESFVATVCTPEPSKNISPFFEIVKGAIINNHVSDSPDDDKIGSEDVALRAIAANTLFDGHIVPALQQKTSDGNTTRDCGYFALYNALSFANPHIFNRLNRKQFTAFLQMALNAMAVYPQLARLDDLDERELRHIITTLHLPVAIFTLDNFLFVAHHDQTFEAVLEESGSKSKELLLNFLNATADNLVMVVFITSRRHWVAINAERQDGRVIFKIADSCCSCMIARSDNPDVRQQVIDGLLEPLVPYHVALSHRISEWKSVLTEELCDPDRKKIAPQCAPGVSVSGADQTADMTVVDCDAIFKKHKELEDENERLRQQQVLTALKPLEKAQGSFGQSNLQAPFETLPGNEGFDRISIAPELAAVCLSNFPEVNDVYAKIQQRTQPVRVLFSGPPNIGKTTLARAIARQLGIKRLFYDCTGGTRYVKAHEEIWDTFVQPVINGGDPCIVILDEIDQLKPINGGENPALHIKQAIADCSAQPQIAFIATTNKPDEIDVVLKSRFRIHHVLARPDTRAKVNIVKYCFSQEAPTVGAFCSDRDLERALGYLDAQTVEDVLEAARNAKNRIAAPVQIISRELLYDACIAVRPTPSLVWKYCYKIGGGLKWAGQKSYEPVVAAGQVAQAVYSVATLAGIDTRRFFWAMPVVGRILSAEKARQYQQDEILRINYHASKEDEGFRKKNPILRTFTTLRGAKEGLQLTCNVVGTAASVASAYVGIKALKQAANSPGVRTACSNFFNKIMYR